MTEASPWLAIREARPQLAPHASVDERDIRGEPWAILQNNASGEQVRLNGPALAIVQSMDGRLRVDEILAAEMPDAGEAERDALATTLVVLESSGLLTFGRDSDTNRLIQRARDRKRTSGWRKRLDPLALRIPLHDPDRWLERLAPWLMRRSGKRILMCSAGLIAFALSVALGAHAELAADFARHASQPAHWWQYAIVYPGLKLVHELAHALVVKANGGVVHEAGLSLLVLMPIPYVDASDSNRFAARSERLAVGAAGMLAEGVIASLGLLLWSVTEPGQIHDLAFATALLGSVSTLLFNANPLLRFDGYHVLQDALDMPNLGTRSSRYLVHLLKRHGLRVAASQPPVMARGESRWLLGYGLASLLYRILLTVGIAVFLLDALPLAGIALALFALYRLFGKPLVTTIRFLCRSPELAGCRTRACLLSVSAVMLVSATVGLLRFPSSTRAEGITRAAGQAAIYAAASGHVVEVIASAGRQLREGDAIARLEAPELQSSLRLLDAEIAVLQSRRFGILNREPGTAARLSSDIEQARREQLELSNDAANLVLRASESGQFAPLNGALQIGQPVQRGEIIGHVIGDAALRVDVVIDQDQIGQVRSGVKAATVRLAERLGTVIPARLSGDTPAADRRLPSAALAFDGSRGIAVASSEAELRTLEPVFHLELELPRSLEASGIGGRAHVTLAHAPETLGRRWWRVVRQLFLEKLSV